MRINRIAEAPRLFEIGVNEEELDAIQSALGVHINEGCENPLTKQILARIMKELGYPREMWEDDIF